MEFVFGIILAALGLWLAIKIFVWAFTALIIIFQLCVIPLIGGAITWWLWDNMWIGVGIGAAIVLYITIKEGGIGWVFDGKSSSSYSTSARRNTPSSTVENNLAYDENASSNKKHYLQEAESYKYEYDYYMKKGDERLSQANTYKLYANDYINKASLYNDTSYLDEARRYEEMAEREADEAQSFYREAERYLNLAKESIHAANMYS